MRRPYYGWVVVFACFLGSFVIFGLSYSFGVFFERILDEFGHPRGVTSIAFGVQTVCLYVGAVVIGALVDRYGTRMMMLLGTLLLCSGLVLTTGANSLFVLILAYGVLVGFGMSIVYVISYATVPQWFDRHQGLAAGVASSGLGFGIVVVAPAANSLIDVVGWRDAFYVLTAGTAALLLLAALLVRDDPASAGAVTPDGEFDTEPSAGSVTPWREQYRAIRSIARTPSFLLVFAGWTLIYLPLYVILVHLVVHAMDLGFSRALGATALSIIGLTSALGRVGIGYLGDRAGRMLTLVACSVVMGVSTALLPLAHTTVSLLLYAAVFGLAYGGNGALLAPLTATLFGRENLNAVWGLVSISFAIAGLTAPSLAGWSHEVLGTYDPIFVVAGLLAVVGAGSVAIANRYASAP